MKKRTTDRNMPIGKLTRINDFLPAPSQLVFHDETVKVTIALNQSSISFFKKQAQKYHTKYQRMIRELLDRYASRYSNAA